MMLNPYFLVKKTIAMCSILDEVFLLNILLEIVYGVAILELKCDLNYKK